MQGPLSGLHSGFVPLLFYFSFFSLSDISDGLCTRITWCLALVNLCACTVGDLSHDNTVLAVKTHNVLSTCIHSYNCVKTQCWSCDELRTGLLMSTTNEHTRLILDLQGASMKTERWKVRDNYSALNIRDFRITIIPRFATFFSAKMTVHRPVLSEPSLIMHHQRAHDCKSNTTLYLYIFIVWKRKGAKKHIRTTRATTETLSVNLALNRIPLSYFDFRTPAPFPLSVRRRQETRLLFRLLLLEAAYLP